MLIPHITRTMPDVVYTIIKNDEASTPMADGDCVIWTVVAGKNHGKDCLLSTGASQLVCAGACKGTILAGEYGRCLIYGWHTNLKMSAATPAAGTTLVSAAAGAFAATGAIGDDPSARLGFLLRAGVASRAGGMIKCMG